jgi:hypothetical protein
MFPFIGRFSDKKMSFRWLVTIGQTYGAVKLSVDQRASRDLLRLQETIFLGGERSQIKT